MIINRLKKIIIKKEVSRRRRSQGERLCHQNTVFIATSWRENRKILKIKKKCNIRYKKGDIGVVKSGKTGEHEVAT